jgi:hypothetical protein
LPAQFAPARFAIWLKQSNLFDAVREEIRASGRTLGHELNNMYVSPYLAAALLKLDAASVFTGSAGEVSKTLQAQYPPNVVDISDDELLNTFEDVLALQTNVDGRLPLTLIVLDEMQQYIGEDSSRALTVQNIVEVCSARFESQVLFVATGQSALTANPTLQKLTDRFVVQVPLSDTDVEAVVRKVILQKKADQVSALKSKLEEVSGEIDRHLGGTRISAVAADKQDLVADYPLLPTRRRFWERALRAIDKAGKAGVLRTQLKIVHEATNKVADDGIGHVVGADFVYYQQSAGMLMSGVLLKEIDELVRGLRDGTDDGELKSRLCALIFLISQLPHSGVGDIGLRATAPFLADLLVEDLERDGAQLRKRTPQLLEELAGAGHLMRIGDEYRLQTEVGAEWTKDFNQRRAAIRDDAARSVQLRDEWIVRTVDDALRGMRLQQGESKTTRKILPFFGEDEPGGNQVDIPVWIRDEWSVSPSHVRNAAAQAGTESPVVFVLLPRRNADAIKDALSSHAAAVETIQQKPLPQTEEGRAAKDAMETRRRTEEGRIEELCGEVIAGARVFQGGGNELTVITFRGAVEIAAERALARMFPKFTVADNSGWGRVVAKAREGSPDALTAVGHQGEVTNQPVCKEILSAVGGGGTKGTDLHKRYGDPPYGWPKDAINGALLTLLAGGHIRAEQDGVRLNSAKELQPLQIGKTTFYKEDQPPTMKERLAVKGLLTEANVKYEPGQESNAIPALLQKLTGLADSAGGPPPLPTGPNTSYITALQAMAGNGQFRAVAERYDQIRSDLQIWRKAAERMPQREAEWSELGRLLRHAEGLPVASEVHEQSVAIEAHRQLLADPDPVKPLLDRLTDELRAQLQERFERLNSSRSHALSALEQSAEWQALESTTRDQILGKAGLSPYARPDISTDRGLLVVLDGTPLHSWEERAELVDARAQHARELAMRKLEPHSVSIKVPATTLKSKEDVEHFLSNLRETLMKHIDAHETVIL